MYAGAEGKYLKKAVDDGVSGIVVAAFGLGNVNESVGDAIRYARSKGVPVVISSRCYNGRTYPLYGGPGGGETLAGAGVLFSGGAYSIQIQDNAFAGADADQGGKEPRKVF